MRLWSLHPKYLDSKGLVALWREALLAQKVLSAETRIYRNDPQMDHFRSQPCPLSSIAAYLWAECNEANERGYRFDRVKILRSEPHGPRTRVTDGQLRYELANLSS